MSSCSALSGKHLETWSVILPDRYLCNVRSKCRRNIADVARLQTLRHPRNIWHVPSLCTDYTICIFSPTPCNVQTFHRIKLKRGMLFSCQRLRVAKKNSKLDPVQLITSTSYFTEAQKATFTSNSVSTHVIIHSNRDGKLSCRPTVVNNCLYYVRPTYAITCALD